MSVKDKVARGQIATKRDKTTKLVFEDVSIPMLEAIAGTENYTVNGKNLFNKINATIGKFVTYYTGELVDDARYDSSERISVSQNTQYSFTDDSMLKMAFFNSAGVYISGLNLPTSPIITPANTAFVQYSFTKESLDIQQFELGAVKTAYEAYFSNSYTARYNPSEIVVDMQPTSIKFYVKGGNGQSSKYLRYQFKHDTVAFDPTGTIPSSNLDGWRLYEVYVVTRTGRFTFTEDYLESIVNAGEWECALQEKTMPDFMGGSYHGDEILTFAHVEFDGVGKTLGSTALFTCKKIKFVQKSQLYRVFTQTPVADHLKVYEVTAERGIRLYQEVKWLVSLILMSSYLTMLPIKRLLLATPFSQITDQCYRDYDYLVKDVSTPALVVSSGATIGRPSVKKTNIWGLASGVSAEVEILQRPAIANEITWISDSVTYNKIYVDICGADYTTTINELMKMETVFKLDIAL